LHLYFMLYTSPFEILDVPGAELQQMDRKLLLLKKKQLLAELELQNGHSIIIKNREFTKNDILGLFEQIENGGAVEYHAAVAADPVLLQFLQTGSIKAGKKFNGNPLYQDASFIEFISPFYKAAFNQFVLKAVAASNYDTTGAVFSNPLLLNGADYDECLSKLHGYLQEKLHNFTLLKNNFTANRYTDLSSLHSYYIYDWILTLNSLPDDFSGYREDYAVELYNFVVDLWNGKKRDEATAMLYGIQNIKTDGNVKKLISDLLDKVSAAQQPDAGSSSGGGVSAGRIVWAVISIIIIILRVANCNRSTSYSSNNFPSYSSLQDGFSTGYIPFSASDKREEAMLALLNTLQHSTTATYKVKKPVVFQTGDDPYRTIFSKPVFKPVPETEKVLEAETSPGYPRVVEDKSLSNDENAVATNTVTREVIKGKTDSISLLRVSNELTLETILFFISKQKVFSVYMAPNSTYTLKLTKGNYHLFGYSGHKFSNTLPLNYSYVTNTSAQKILAGLGRFDEINSKMLLHLKPEKNICFMAGYDMLSVEGQASLTINFDNEEYFDIEGGKGISPIKTLIPRRSSY
jgi:hypothetical protein